MRHIILAMFLTFGIVALARADLLEVSAKSFKTNLAKGITELDGEVIVVKGTDKLWADNVVIETDSKNQPQKYTATGNVRFYAKLPDKEMKGKAHKVIYDVGKDRYQLLQNAMIEEVGKKNVIRGESIVFSPSTQEANIKGSENKPSVMTFVIEDKADSQKETP